MAGWDDQFWESSIIEGLPRRERRSGVYRSYAPDSLTATSLFLTPEIDILISEAERAVRNSTDSRDLEGIARFFLRSEAIASSRIEGVAPGTRQVAFAELETTEGAGSLGASEQAQLVARNMTVVERARSELATADAITLEHIVSLQMALVAETPTAQGIRTVQNWIGGSSYHPLGADFVPPAPQRLIPLLDDLVAYANGATHSPIVQAALVHAQFETLHPFADGNGRVGRALIHTILIRRGLSRRAVLPISQVLSTLRQDYVRALDVYHYTGAPNGEAFHAARAAWIEFFARAIIIAADQAERTSEELDAIRAEWEEKLTRWRTSTGHQRTLRSTSVTARILEDLPSTPVLTTMSASRIHDVTPQAAYQGLQMLENAGVLSSTTRKGHTIYFAPLVLDLVDLSVRRLASTRFDTRISPPRSAVPARPHPPTGERIHP